MSRSMYRYQVGVDGPVEHGLTGDPVAVGALAYSSGVEFWAEHDESKLPVVRAFVIVGTGHRIPEGAVHVGTAPRTPEGLVWHLFELPRAESWRTGEGGVMETAP